MDKYTEGLIEGMGHAAKRINEIVDGAEERAAAKAKAENRAVAPNDYTLSPEEQTSLDAANAAYDDYKKRADDLAASRERAAAADQARASIKPALDFMRENADVSKASVEIGPDGWVTRASLEWARTGRESSFESRQHLPLGIAGQEEYRRALSVGSQGAGTTFPIGFIDNVHIFERTLNPMLDLSTVWNQSTGAPLQVPTATADVTAGGSVTAEAGGITEGDPTLSTPQINTFKIAHTVLYSAEIDQDNVVGLDNVLARLVSRPIGLGWGTYFTLGTGTTQPFGFLARAQNGGTASGTTDYGASGKYIGWGDAYTLYYALAAPYRLSGSFQTNSMARIRQWRDNNNQPVFQPSLIVGSPDMLIGRPIYENPAMAAAGSANTALAFGDFSQYYVVNVAPVRVDISRDYKFNTDQLALRVATRRGGDLIDAAAVKFLVSQAV